MLTPLMASATSELGVAVDLGATAGFTVAAVIVASWRFSREQAYEPLIHILTGKRG